MIIRKDINSKYTGLGFVNIVDKQVFKGKSNTLVSQLPWKERALQKTEIK